MFPAPGGSDGEAGGDRKWLLLAISDKAVQVHLVLRRPLPLYPALKMPPIRHATLVNVGDCELPTTVGNDGIHRVQCDFCFTTIKLTTGAHPERILKHRAPCKARYLRARLPPATAAVPEAPRARGRSTQPKASGSHLFHPYSRSSSYHSDASSASQTSAPPTPTSAPPSTGSFVLIRKCQEVDFEWTPGSIWTTYPYQQHAAREMGWTIIRLNEKKNTLGIQAKDCRINLPERSSSMSCDACLCLLASDGLSRLAARAKEPVPHKNMPTQFLNAHQMAHVLRENSMTMQTLRTQVRIYDRYCILVILTKHVKLSNSYRSNKLLKAMNNDFKQIVMLLVRNNIPGLRRLLAAGLKRGASPKTLIDLLDQAVRRMYSAKNFLERDMDIAFMVKALGGPRLLYALQRAMGLPSETTLRRHCKIPTLIPSIGKPARQDVDDNITNFCDPNVMPAPPVGASGRPTGNILMFDGVALETKCAYCPRRNAVLGLCREHSEGVNTTVDTPESVDKIRHRLFTPDSPESKLCFGLEGTVLGVAPYARKDQYSTIPVALSPSDKTEKGHEMIEWIVGVIRAWKEHKYGEAVHGPIWALGSDGDSSYRAAKHLYCILWGEEFDPTTEAGRTLRLLEGLNLYMSVDGIVPTANPKHIFKCRWQIRLGCSPY
jgi:hypothetical protein